MIASSISDGDCGLTCRRLEAVDDFVHLLVQFFQLLHRLVVEGLVVALLLGFFNALGNFFVEGNKAFLEFFVGFLNLVFFILDSILEFRAQAFRTFDLHLGHTLELLDLLLQLRLF